ncbi:MAG: Acg family FMN-binding oxidoreductase [Gemmobacter sp.]
MTLSRRRTLALIGGGTILAATAGGTAFALTRTPTRALAPWSAAGSYADPRKNALSWAILAPNPHNRQPWQVALTGDNGLTIWRDPARNLPHTDPHDRQMTIGMGCFLELMVIAASGTGHAVDVTLFPEGEGDGRPVATATFRAGAAEPHPLLPQVPHRRSTKEPYEARALSADHAVTIGSFATVITDPDQVAALRTLTWDAWMIEAETPRTHGESVELMRFGKAEIEANPDGIDLGGPFLETLMLARVLTRAAQLDPTSQGFRQGVVIYKAMLAATPAYGVITTTGNTRADQIDAGRRWLRLNLVTTALGVSLHPVSQALQEFPEMAGPYARAHAMLASPGETVQMLGRLGYGPASQPTPRWPLETRMLDA